MFPNNIEVAFEVPMANGELKTLHYSISEIEGDSGYKPRKADQRIGYFTTRYSDYGKYESDDTEVRYINRWHLEKRDPKLKLSPPKEPIVFYIEHTDCRSATDVGCDKACCSWNKAFRTRSASPMRSKFDQQDKHRRTNMDKDPEDVRYNFVRWLNNNVSTAIGPSRVNPRTGQILDADIVLTDGWIRAFEDQFSEIDAQESRWRDDSRDARLVRQASQLGSARANGRALCNASSFAAGEPDQALDRGPEISGRRTARPN